MTTETSNARGEVVAWIRVKPDGSPDWAEDCIADDEHFLNPAMEADGYRLRPLIYADTAPPPAAARGDVRGLVERLRHYANVQRNRRLPANASLADEAADTLAALAAEGVQAEEVEQRDAALPVSEQAVSDVAWHIGKSIDYIDHHYPGTKHLDAGPILRNMRRWHQRLTAALTEARNG